MSLKTIFSIALFLSVFIILVSCSSHKTEWQGTIEEVDGVTVVKNPIEPMYGSHVFALEEELLLSDKGKEDIFIFTRLCNISVDDDENIYVCDQQEGHILKFDINGNYLQKIGRMGSGPGEFNVPYFVKCLGDGKIAVEDRDKLFFSHLI